MPRLSKADHETLVDMERSDDYHAITVREYAELNRLADRGLIERDPLHSNTYRITEAGREAVREAGI